MKLTKKRLAQIVFDHNDKASRTFDLVLLALIFGSVLVAVLDSVGELHDVYGDTFYILELLFTFLFTIEYILRIWLTSKTFRYVTSFFGIVDLLAILPVYLSFFVVNIQLLTVVRALRLLRVIRILKLGRYLSEAAFIRESLKASMAKIQIFLFTVLTIVLIMGTLMYLVEGPEAGYTSIPRGMYWAIVTLTTVGFGDITPATPLGQFIASLIMLLGYAIIAVPTGIVSSEMAKRRKPEEIIHTKVCHSCGEEGLGLKDLYCRHCGEELDKIR
ncbi:MAG: voltage-gated potassium channel TrkA [Algoriphagus marincola HL-49]|uniref:Voltage-gated potassium channel TrkA n=1 Tax=Algoriphagus marincola HL-49 TaxID=1305737 RepID=A0A0P7YUB9_9BACT|nr:MAG: voltage-gated potassium channel TrkA [Algoriphagus marincola HL-49]